MKQTTKETTVITPTARVTAARLAIRAARPRRLTSTLLWAAQIQLAACFMFGAAVRRSSPRARHGRALVDLLGREDRSAAARC